MNRGRLSISILLIVIAFDQLTKQLIRIFSVNCRLFSFLSFSFTKNTGAAFGILKGNNLGLLFIALIVFGFGLYYHESLLKCRDFWAFALIGGGLIGNLIDRIIFGFVIDFIDFQVWPVFNIADSAITIGVVAMVFYMIRNSNT